jgi:hypothetical protein
MNIFDVYGFESSNIETIKETLERMYLLEFVPHESEFLGDYYIATADCMKTYKLYQNRDGDDFHEDDYKSCAILLSIDYIEDSQYFMKLNMDNGIGAIPLRRFEHDGEMVRSYRFEGNEPILEAETLVSRQK